MGEHSRRRGADPYPPAVRPATQAGGPGSYLPQQHGTGHGHPVLGYTPDDGGPAAEPEDLEITPAESGICGYCQRQLDDGESHLHGGQAADPVQEQVRAALADAAVAYAAALDSAFGDFMDCDRAAWNVYVRQRELAWEAYGAAKTAAEQSWLEVLPAMQGSR